MKKDIAELVDELSITNLKIWFLVEKAQRGESTPEESKKLQDLNSYRSQLKNAINSELGGRIEVKI